MIGQRGSQWLLSAGDPPPPQLHLIIASRSDPLLPLARLRARGHLLELRTPQLRFQMEETRAFFREAQAFTVADEDAELLHQRTEGWIAGLQMAALSMQGQPDLHAFVTRFSGDHRFILDYLNDEVLGHEPAHIRDFLQQTAILQRLNAPLCDALTGRRNPLQHPILKGLGRYGEPQMVLDAIEGDLAQGYRQLHKLILTRQWVLCASPKAFHAAARLDSLTWIYPQIIRSRYWSIHRVVLWDKHGMRIDIRAREAQMHEMLVAIAQAAPHVLVGHTPELDKRWKQQRAAFVKEVETRRQQLVQA